MRNPRAPSFGVRASAPTPVRAWDLVPPSAMSSATALVAPSGALTVEASDDPDYTLKMSFNDTANDSGLYALDFDLTPYLSDDAAMLLVEYGPRGGANNNFGIYMGIRAASETNIPMVSHNGGSGSSRAGIWGGVFNLSANTATAANFPVASTTSWVIGARLSFGVGDAAKSPTATGVLAGPVTTSIGSWPQWLDPAAPSNGDLLGASNQTAASAGGNAAIITAPPRVPGAGRTLVIRPTANLAGDSFTDQYVRLAFVRPDAGQV